MSATLEYYFHENFPSKSNAEKMIPKGPRNDRSKEGRPWTPALASPLRAETQVLESRHLWIVLALSLKKLKHSLEPSACSWVAQDENVHQIHTASLGNDEQHNVTPTCLSAGPDWHFTGDRNNYPLPRILLFLFWSERNEAKERWVNSKTYPCVIKITSVRLEIFTL